MQLLQTTQRINLAFLEVLMRAYYFHTRQVADAKIPEAVTQAQRRMKKFLKDVAELRASGTGNLYSLTQALRTVS